MNYDSVLFRYDSALSDLLDLIVIVEQLLHMTKYTEVIGCQTW